VDTGFPAADSRDDFARARRNASLTRLAARLRLRSGDLDVLLPFDEVVAALGRRGEQPLGRRTVALDDIVGSVDRRTGFDRRFRPTSDLARARFERIAEVVRRGGSLPPVDLYQVGDVYFVLDGHHRVAVFRALGFDQIEARVTLIQTLIGAGSGITLQDLPLKSHTRVFFERVPLPSRLRDRIELDEADDYGALAESVEAWGMRWMQELGRFAGRSEVALAWFTDEYEPVLTLLREAGLHPASGAQGESDTQAYMRLSRERYEVMRTHSWDDEVIERLRLRGRR
jgi:hypothetical protein